LFRSLLVDNWLRFFFSPSLGALGGLVAWLLYSFSDGINEMPVLQHALWCAFMGFGIAVACNLLPSIQDGQGFLRTWGRGIIAGIVGGILGLGVGGLVYLITKNDPHYQHLLNRLALCLLAGTFIGLSSRITSLDRFTGLATLGGLLGGMLSLCIWYMLDIFGTTTDFYTAEDIKPYIPLLVPMTLGFGIGATTYSLPSFVSGGNLTVLTGQFKGQDKQIQSDDILVGNNKRQLQWVLPKWEGVQDPHARLEVKAEGQGYKHSIRNLCTKNVIVVRDGKKHRIKTKQTMPLEDEDVLVFATGRNYVKVRYNQKTAQD
jgi:hypothetical protein